MFYDPWAKGGRYEADWDAHMRRWRRYRVCCYALLAIGLLLVAVDLFWAGVGVVGVAVAGFISWQNYARRERKHWESLSRARGGGASDDGWGRR